MSISIGDRLPEATFRFVGADGPDSISSTELFAGKVVAVFSMPGAFTGTCTGQHVPSILRTAAAMREKGVHEIVVLAVNDIFVMDVWADQTGAKAGGLKVLADPASEFTKAVGMDFSADVVGFVDRSKRYSMLVRDGEVTAFNAEDAPGSCDISSGETLLDQI